MATGSSRFLLSTPILRQRKHLTSNMISNGTISDLTFTGLIPGNTYEIVSYWSVLHDTASDALQIEFIDSGLGGGSGNRIQRPIYGHVQTNGHDDRPNGHIFTHTMVGDALSFSATSLAGGDLLRGNALIGEGACWVEVRDITGRYTPAP